MKIDTKVIFKSNDLSSALKIANDLFISDYTKEITSKAKDNCPVVTGKLQESITDINVINGQGEVKAETDYATAVELGTQYTAPQLFIQKAISSTKPNPVIITKTLEDECNKPKDIK